MQTLYIESKTICQYIHNRYILFTSFSEHNLLFSSMKRLSVVYIPSLTSRTMSFRKKECLPCRLDRRHWKNMTLWKNTQRPWWYLCYEIPHILDKLILTRNNYMLDISWGLPRRKTLNWITLSKHTILSFGQGCEKERNIH